MYLQNDYYTVRNGNERRKSPSHNERHATQWAPAEVLYTDYNYDECSKTRSI